MAYLKLVMNHTQWGGSTNMSNAAHRWYVMHEIQEFLNGNHTATSDMNSTYINTAASVIINDTADRPSANIYRSIAGNNSSAASYNNQYIQFKKYHYGNQETGSTDTNFGSYNYIFIRWYDTYGLMCRTMDKALSQSFPYSTGNTAGTWTGDTGTSQWRFPMYPGQCYAIHVIMTNKMFGMWVEHSNVTTDKFYTHVLTDLEFNPDLMRHTWSGNNFYCPQYTINAADNRLRVDADSSASNTSTTSNSKRLTVGMKHRVGANGIVNPNPSPGSYYHWGYPSTTAAYYYYPSYFPAPWYDMPTQIPVANGDTGYLMQPLTAWPNTGYVNRNGNHYDYHGYPRMMNIWRTNDEAFGYGERVSKDGKYYRAFRIHRCGGGYGNHDGLYRNACYLVPEGRGD
jgi:hypothetical protein